MQVQGLSCHPLPCPTGPAGVWGVKGWEGHHHLHVKASSALTGSTLGLLGLVGVSMWWLRLFSVGHPHGPCCNSKSKSVCAEAPPALLPHSRVMCWSLHVDPWPRSLLLRYKQRSTHLLPLLPEDPVPHLQTYGYMDLSDILLCCAGILCCYWMSVWLYLRSESLREQLTPPWCWHHSKIYFSCEENF